MAVDTLEMAQAMRRSGLPQDQADTVAEEIGKDFANEEFATKEFVRSEIAGLRAELHREMGLLPRKVAGMLLLQAGLVAALTKFL